MNTQLLKRCLWAAFLFLLLLGCQLSGSDTTSGDGEGRQPFFDMRGYFTRQIEQLQDQQPPVRKTITFNHETDTQMLDSLDYDRELEVFLNADINRAAWWDRYRIDSSFNDRNQLDSVTYTAIGEDLRVRRLKVEYKNGEVNQIEVQSETTGPAADRWQQLFFDPQWGYRIESRQNVAFSKPRETKIEVRFEQE
jgi:hypothetical protein